MPALYVTIWLALLLFAVGETGRTAGRAGPRPPEWAWWTFTLGLVLALVHTVLAFATVHHWVHADAVAATAEQTRAVFRVGVGWGVYVNYFFFAAWLADLCWWRTAQDLSRRPAALTRALRAFYLLIIVNGAVVFAGGARRILGLVIVSWLVWLWTRGAGPRAPEPPPPPRQ